MADVQGSNAPSCYLVRRWLATGTLDFHLYDLLTGRGCCGAHDNQLFVTFCIQEAGTRVSQEGEVTVV